MAGRYAAKDNQTTENLVHLKDDIIVGEWRDSTYGKDIFSSLTYICCSGQRSKLRTSGILWSKILLYFYYGRF